MRNEAHIQQVKDATLARFQNLWRENFKANLPAIQRHSPVAKLARKFKKTPAILVGAGPSLDKNIHYLKEAHGKALILASDAAYKPLAHHGIFPSMTVCLDPQEEITKFFTGVTHRDVTLIAPTIIHPHVIDIWQGSVVFYHQHAPDIPVLMEIVNQLPQLGALTPGGSVLSVGYHLAYEMGCDPILFLGQDLSYPKTKTYSRLGANEGETLTGTLNRQQENIVYEEDMNGARLPTLKSMSVSKQWFNWAFTTWKRDLPLTVVNCSEGGILTDNVLMMSFREAIYNYCDKKINVAWQLKKILKSK
ncbi:MAG: motility associated factor glycosyltransferase family protein [Nitrospina sp.]|nr:motility associated factor glycosyltransferase family protein [Nitrospina sp.]